MTQAVAPTATGTGNVLFELERLEHSDDGRLELTGRWFGVRGRRFVRPTLTLVADGRPHRLLADLEHKPWPAEDGAEWRAAFPWDSGNGPLSEVELSVAPDIALQLSGPADGSAAPPELPEGDSPARRELQRTWADLADERRERGRLRRELDATAEELDRAREQLAELREASVEANAALARRDAALAKLGSRRAEAERDAAVADRDAALADREGAHAERDRALVERDNAMSGRDQTARDAIRRCANGIRPHSNEIRRCAGAPRPPPPRLSHRQREPLVPPHFPRSSSGPRRRRATRSTSAGPRAASRSQCSS